MYDVIRNGKPALEADACGIGLVATRKGVATREVIDFALDFSARFDHRGSPGHGAGFQLEIPWPLLLDRFPEFTKEIAQRNVALATFFLPFDTERRSQCVQQVERIAASVGADILSWSPVPINLHLLEPESKARRMAPRVRQALIRRPDGLSEDGWFACRYLLRLAIDAAVTPIAGDEFSLVSLSNRTVVYKGLAPLSQIGALYPDLANPDFASRFVVFHSRYCTNTTTAWRRAQPFWATSHNGEINTIRGNVAWINAIGPDLIRGLIQRHTLLAPLATTIRSVVCSGGSDTANLDDMLISLIAGGMSLSESVLALLPPAQLPGPSPRSRFFDSMSMYLGACDGPAALIACDGDEAVMHLDRNGLRPLWLLANDDWVLGASEPTGTFPGGVPVVQRILGPGETVAVRLADGAVRQNGDLHEEIMRRGKAFPAERLIDGPAPVPFAQEPQEPATLRSFGMTEEDVDVVLAPLFKNGKAAVGSMGDDTPPSAMLDRLPRRLEDYFQLRFAQETSPPIDPLRDAWVFDARVALGDRSGLWSCEERPVIRFDSRLLSRSQAAWVMEREFVRVIDLSFPATEGADGIEKRLDEVIAEALEAVGSAAIVVLSDRAAAANRITVPSLRAVSRVHSALVANGKRHRVGVLAHVGVWDVHHVALAVTMGADAVAPWLGAALADEAEALYLRGLHDGLLEAMSMVGVTPSAAYCGARLAECVGLDREFVAREFPGVPAHLGGIGSATLNKEWEQFHAQAYAGEGELPDAGEFRHTKDGRPHANNAEVVRLLHSASGYAKKIHVHPPGTREAYLSYAELVRGRAPISVLDCLAIRPNEPVPLEEVEALDRILWRFMAPGMSEGALSEPAHRAVARSMNALFRYVRYCSYVRGEPTPLGVGPIANSGEGGFAKDRMRRNDGNRSIQYAGGRFTITPFTAATAAEAEVKFAQGAKPGKGGQLPGKKVNEYVARQRGCEPGYELVSPPINHNLYSIEDVKLMVESWRVLNPDVFCSLKYVATHGVEMVALGGVNAGATRLHISDGCGGTGAAKRVDQKHAGIPAAVVLPAVQDALVEEELRHLVEISADGGVQSGHQALKLFLLGADRVGFGTSLLMAIGCSMLRKCHLAGPDPADPSGKRRLGCTPGVATQDPVHIARFSGKSKHITRFLYFVAQEIRDEMAAHGIRRLGQVVGRRDLLVRRTDLAGKAAELDFRDVLLAPHAHVPERRLEEQSRLHMPDLREAEAESAERALAGEHVTLPVAKLTNEDRCVGMRAAGVIARARGDEGLTHGSWKASYQGAAGHYFGAYLVPGMELDLQGVAADSAFTASYGGRIVVKSTSPKADLTVIGNAFGYGARGGEAFINGRAGNRFGICFRKNHEGGGPRVVVEGVQANAFQYMTGGVALVLGSMGPNVGSGMTGGTIYALDLEEANLNPEYVSAQTMEEADREAVQRLLQDHLSATGSPLAECLLRDADWTRFRAIRTCRVPESWA
jgi:glutamate synthase domain-containing protein 2/glutamate synthase domain-containing protein 1/glutamate synthase domain-containing protein 3